MRLLRPPLCAKLNSTAGVLLVVRPPDGFAHPHDAIGRKCNAVKPRHDGIGICDTLVHAGRSCAPKIDWFIAHQTTCLQKNLPNGGGLWRHKCPRLGVKWHNDNKHHDTKNLARTNLKCCLFSDDEKRKLVHVVAESGADYVKTSTGFAASGATVNDVRLLSEVASARIKVKAAGGIRDWPTCQIMLEAGADRIGTSVGTVIVQQWQKSAGLV